MPAAARAPVINSTVGAGIMNTASISPIRPPKNDEAVHEARIMKLLKLLKLEQGASLFELERSSENDQARMIKLLEARMMKRF